MQISPAGSSLKVITVFAAASLIETSSSVLLSRYNRSHRKATKQKTWLAPLTQCRRTVIINDNSRDNNSSSSSGNNNNVNARADLFKFGPPGA